MEGKFSNRFVMIFALSLLINKTAAANCRNHSCSDYKPYCTEIGCVYSCPQSDYINGSTCVASCRDMFVDKEKKCQKECPSEQFVNEITVRIGEKLHIVKHCIKECVKYVYHGTCVPTCPADTHYVDDKTCVEKCPEEKQLIKKAKHVITNKTQFEYSFCVSSCPEKMFLFGNMCVELCPDGMFVSTHICVDKCPATQPVFEEVYINIDWKFEKYFKCTSTCSHLSHCFCPEEIPYFFSNSCFESCPHIGMFVRHRSGLTECVEDCYENEVNFNLTCANTCPSNYSHIFNKICLRTCPAGYLRIPFQNYPGPHGSYQTYQCIHKCPGGFFILNNKECVSRCPNMHSGNKCLDMCPTNAPFINYRECTAQCPHYIVNNTCVEGCPKEQQYVIETVNGTCLPGCPREYKLKRKIDAIFNHFKTKKFERLKNIVCLQECSPDEFLYNSTCVSKCPQGANYAVNKSCISTPCSPSYMIENVDTIFCGQNCPNETPYLSSNYCVKQCSFYKPFISKNMTCLDKCPFIERHVHNYVCSDTCSEQELLKNGACILIQDCKMPSVVFKTECMEYCPALYKANFNDNQCESSMPVIITIVCIGIILIGFVVWKRVPIANFLEVTKNAVLLLVKGDKFDMALYDKYIPNRPITKRTKRNRGSAGSIISEDGIPMLDVGRSYSDDDEHEDTGRGEVNIDISDPITFAHCSNEVGDNESEV